MTEYESPGRELARGAGRLLAIVAGLVLMVVGLGMGVSVVLLPVGIPVGLVGLLLFVGGLSPRAGGAGNPAQPLGRQ